MVFQLLQTSVFVFNVCLVLVITSAGNFKVSAAAQQFEAQTLEGGCPVIQDDFARVKSEILQYIGPLIEQLSEPVTRSPTTRQTTEQNTTLPTTGETTAQSTTLPTTGETTEQSTTLPTTGETTEQSTTLPTTGETTEQSTTLPTTGEATEQSTPTTTEPLYACNGTPGWRQVVFINMTDTSYNCPPGLNLTSYSKRTCGRAHSNNGDCSSTTFSVGDSDHSRVCGRIRGYQVGDTQAFIGYILDSQSIDGYYVDGVSLTHGAVGGRQHIWTFAAGLTEVDDGQVSLTKCPCDTSDEAIVSPPFVGNDYFCESGLHSLWNNEQGVPFLDDPLWDGQNCTSTSTCCQFNNTPWFTKNLPNPTTDNVELRLCLNSSPNVDDIALELIELYIQ